MKYLQASFWRRVFLSAMPRHELRQEPQTAGLPKREHMSVVLAKDEFTVHYLEENLDPALPVVRRALAGEEFHFDRVSLGGDVGEVSSDSQ